MVADYVLLHGLGGSPRVWDRLVPLLARHRAVHVPRMPVDHTVADAAADVVGRIRADAGARRYVLVGQSLGGLVATSIAEQFPAVVERLVLVDPVIATRARLTANGPRERILHAPLIARTVWAAPALARPLLRRGLASAFAPGVVVPEFFVDDLLDTGAQSFLAADDAIRAYVDERSLTDRVADLDASISVHLVYGSSDQRVDPRALADLGASLPPESVTRIEGVGHTPQWELPEVVARAVLGRAEPAVTGTRDSTRSGSRLRLRPQRWRPPRAPRRASQQLETAGPLHRIELPGIGPEHVVVDRDGRIVTGLADGRLVRVTLTENGDRLVADDIETIADTGGRPLGMAWADEHTLLVCDSDRGLMRVELGDHDAQVSVLVDSVDGEPLNFTSNVAVGGSGTVYFSASTRRFRFEDYAGDLLEHSGTGRLVSRAPTGEVRLLADGLQFANGIRIPPDESWVDVAETGRFAVTRIHLGRDSDPMADSMRETVVDNLPGHPDNMTSDDGAEGSVTWLALASPRNRLLDLALPLPGIFRRLVWAGPSSLRRIGRTVWVVAIDQDGAMVHDLQTGTADYAAVTSACPWGRHLILGSITETALAVIRRPESATNATMAR